MGSWAVSPTATMSLMTGRQGFIALHCLKCLEFFHQVKEVRAEMPVVQASAADRAKQHVPGPRC